MIDGTTAILERALDIRMQKHALHVSNIANANVPEFKAKTLDFEDRMRAAMDYADKAGGTEKAREEILEQVSKSIVPDVYQDPLAIMKGDGNTVNVDKEQTELAKNTIAYEGAIQLINKKFALQKYVLSEGAK